MTPKEIEVLQHLAAGRDPWTGVRRVGGARTRLLKRLLAVGYVDRWPYTITLLGRANLDAALNLRKHRNETAPAS